MNINNDAFGGFIVSKDIIDNGAPIYNIYRIEPKQPGLNGWAILSKKSFDNFGNNDLQLEAVYTAQSLFSVQPIMLELFDAPFGTDVVFIYPQDNTKIPIGFWDLNKDCEIDFDQILHPDSSENNTQGSNENDLSNKFIFVSKTIMEQGTLPIVGIKKQPNKSENTGWLIFDYDDANKADLDKDTVMPYPTCDVIDKIPFLQPIIDAPNDISLQFIYQSEDIASFCAYWNLQLACSLTAEQINQLQVDKYDVNDTPMNQYGIQQLRSNFEDIGAVGIETSQLMLNKGLVSPQQYYQRYFNINKIPRNLETDSDMDIDEYNNIYGGFIVSKKIMRGEALPFVIDRGIPHHPNFSGWMILAKEDYYQENVDLIDTEIVPASIVFKILPYFHAIYNAPYGVELAPMYATINDSRLVVGFKDLDTNKQLNIGDVAPRL